MAAAYAIESLGLSERRACLLTGISPSVYRYKSKQGDDAVLRRRMRELAWERKRFGSPRLPIMLKREGLVINHKRTERIYSEEGLALRKKRRRKGAAGVRETIPSPVRPNQRWSMDFVSDSTVTGRCFRALAIVDDYSRECPAIEVDTSLGGARVVGVLERLEETRGLPEVITVDNGPEFAGKAMDEWAYRRGIKLSFIRPGKPVENASAESFNGRLRDECLNINPELPISNRLGPSKVPSTTRAILVLLTDAVNHPIERTEPSVGVVNWRSMGSGGGFHHVCTPFQSPGTHLTLGCLSSPLLTSRIIVTMVLDGARRYAPTLAGISPGTLPPRQVETPTSRHAASDVHPS